MKMTKLRWVLVGALIALVSLGSAGHSVVSILPYAFLIACPLMMLGMHGGHRGHGAGRTAPDKTSSNLHDQER